MAVLKRTNHILNIFDHQILLEYKSKDFHILLYINLFYVVNIFGIFWCK